MCVRDVKVGVINAVPVTGREQCVVHHGSC